MAVKIITDSSSDLSPAYAADNDIDIIPLRILFGEESYLSGVEMNPDQFFRKLETVDELPKTSQPTPGELHEVFSRYLDAGDEVVAVFISSEMSGTYHAACLLKENENLENLHIVDSQTVTFALGILVMEAVRLKEKGLLAKEIFEELERVKEKVYLYASVGTLKYLQMGGRLSSTSAFFGSVLNIKPIITIKGGLVEAIDKQRGQKRAFDALVELLKKGNVDLERPRVFAHTDQPALMEELVENVARYTDFNTDAFARCDIGATVGVHVGPGACGFAFFAK